MRAGAEPRAGIPPRADDRYERYVVNMRAGLPIAAPVEALIALGYMTIGWKSCLGGYFTALDEFGIPAIVFVDVAPLRDGYPIPRVSCARESWMSNACQAYLQDEYRLRKVHADYLVLPENFAYKGEVPLTHRTGIAWAFASNIARRLDHGPQTCANRLIYGAVTP